MNFHQFECFLAVVEEGSISGAARKLYVSESSVSQTIRRMETELGIQLFNRSKHLMKLTYAGRQYFQTTHSILKLHRNFLSEVSGYDKNISGELSISIFERRAKEVLPKVLPIFMEDFPNIKIKIQDQRLPQDIREKQLLEGQCDMVITNKKILLQEIENIPFCQEQLCLIVSKNSQAISRLFPDGIVREKLSAKRLHGEKLILLQKLYHGRILIDKIFNDLNIKPEILIEIASTERAKELAIAGIGCGISNITLKNGHIDNVDQGDYYTTLIDHPFAIRDVFVSYNKTYSLSTFHKAFMDIIVEQFK